MRNFSQRMRMTQWILIWMLLLTVWGRLAHARDDSCRYCGMKRAQFGHSWTILTYADQTVEMVCSVHCAAIAMALHTDKPIAPHNGRSLPLESMLRSVASVY